MGFEGDTTQGTHVDELRHDARQPLATLRVIIDVAQARSPDPPLRVLLDHVLDQVDFLDALLGGTADVGPKVVVDLLAIAHVVARDVGTRFARTIEVGGAALQTLGDPTALRRALVNLATNACEGTPAHGSVRIVLSCRGPAAVIDVTDDGRGFSAPRTTDARAGRGLGLGIVQRIAHGHGGSLHVRSAPTGSTVTLALPLAESRP